METIKIRASSGYKMMAKGKGEITEIQLKKIVELENKEKLTDNQRDELARLIEKRNNPKPSDTMITYLEELWLEENYGYKEVIYTRPMLKGLLMEQDAFSLVQKVLGGEFRISYRQILKAAGKKRLEDKFTTGVPDIVLIKEDFTEDIKICENLKTFKKAKLSPVYEWQGQIYMHLTGKKHHRVIYCLLPTLDNQILNAKTNIYYVFDCNETNEDYIAASKQIEWNLRDCLEQIPLKDRIKVFTIDYDPLKYAALCENIKKAREYYSKIELKKAEDVTEETENNEA